MNKTQGPGRRETAGLRLARSRTRGTSIIARNRAVAWRHGQPATIQPIRNS